MLQEVVEDDVEFSRRPSPFPFLILVLAALSYLVIAHYKEWEPFPHHATAQELQDKRAYERLGEAQTDAYTIGGKIASIDLSVRMLTAQNHGADSSTWSPADQKTLAGLNAQRVVLVQQRHADVEFYNGYMKTHDYKFTKPEDIPVIVVNRIPLERQLSDTS